MKVLIFPLDYIPKCSYVTLFSCQQIGTHPNEYIYIYMYIYIYIYIYQASIVNPYTGGG